MRRRHHDHFVKSIDLSHAVDISNVKHLMIRVHTVALLSCRILPINRRTPAHRQLKSWGLRTPEGSKCAGRTPKKRNRRIGTSLIQVPSRLSLFRHRWVAGVTARRTAAFCAPVTITSLCAQIDSLAHSHAELQIAAGREPQTMGLNLWSNITL